MSGRDTVPRSQEGVAIRLAFPPHPHRLPAPAQPSLELEESRTESHPARDAVPSEVLLPARKLDLGLGDGAAEGWIRTKDMGLAVLASGGKGGRGQWGGQEKGG